MASTYPHDSRSGFFLSWFFFSGTRMASDGRATVTITITNFVFHAYDPSATSIGIPSSVRRYPSIDISCSYLYLRLRLCHRPSPQPKSSRVVSSSARPSHPRDDHPSAIRLFPFGLHRTCNTSLCPVFGVVFVCTFTRYSFKLFHSALYHLPYPFPYPLYLIIFPVPYLFYFTLTPIPYNTQLLPYFTHSWRLSTVYFGL
ncbi:hypothetical protein GALMADRAFT_849292 [Galerina marginata CBS 339.88]|uniref:Uncharacterized protein n=1 Tax=Galerina marginata (strain CBS 339.88) TaxID=685588 RepID=A0A067TKD0_GALM3|nr:hypothetical protein GALMADRAFT_849292 [Galerina marginata CBS 339.88]